MAFTKSPQLIHFHNDHIVKCSRCNSVVVSNDGTRVYSNSIKRNKYVCHDCGKTFGCCTKKYKYKLEHLCCLGCMKKMPIASYLRHVKECFSMLQLLAEKYKRDYISLST